MALQKVDFKNAFAFDRAMLLALPQGTVTLQPPEFDHPATFSGPLLREVLGYLEAAQVRTNFVAMNGYTGWLDPDDIKSSDWILALVGRRRAAWSWAAGADLAAQHPRA